MGAPRLRHRSYGHRKPVLDGLETTHELRRREQAQGRRYTPTIGLSADAILENRDMARLVGMDEFATKPIEIDRLQKLIESQVARHAGEPEPQAAPAPCGQAQVKG